MIARLLSKARNFYFHDFGDIIYNSSREEISVTKLYEKPWFSEDLNIVLMQIQIKTLNCKIIIKKFYDNPTSYSAEKKEVLGLYLFI